MSGIFSEVGASMKNNKLRTFLTGFTIAFGIIILIVLLGVGDGVRKGMTQVSDDFGLSHFGTTLDLWKTSLPYAGYQKGRKLELTPTQVDYLREKFADDTYGIEPTLGGYWQKFDTNYGTLEGQLKTSSPLSEQFRTLRILEGRTFSTRELEDGERVALLSKSGISKLFKAGTDPIGQIITTGGISYRVIGVTENVNPFFTIITIPASTYTGLYPSSAVKITTLTIYPKRSDPAFMASFEKELTTTIATMLRVDPEDSSAIRLESATDVKNAMGKTFHNLDILLWIMGLGCLAIGSIGVSTIMSVTVRERMREIGIRKALGATPRSIMQMVLGESVLLSICSGAIGLLLGIGIVDLIGRSAETGSWAVQEINNGNAGQEAVYFHIISDPTVNVGVAIGALIVLVAVGLIAGIRPARHAIHVPAVIAMRDK